MNDILRHLLESTAFALVVALIVFQCRNHRASVRYHLWLLAALKFAVPTSLFVTAGQWIYHAWSPQNLFPAMSWYGPDKHTFLSSTPVSAPSGVFGQALWLVWMFGSGLHLGAWLLRLRQTQSTIDVSASVSQMVFQLQRRMSLRRLVKVRSAAPEGELALSGIWSSVLFIPPGLDNSLTCSEWEAVLLHELIHAKRWDNLAAVMVHLLVCLFWFHPVLWWIERRIIAEREFACDEAVLEYGSPPDEYVAGILKVCRFHLVGLQPGACGAASSDWKKRMAKIMAYRTSQPTQHGSTWVVGLVGTLMTVVPLALGFWQAPALYERADQQRSTICSVARHQLVSCLADGKSYVEGTTVEHEGVQQLCVESFGKPLWVRTTPEMRDRSHSVVVLPNRSVTLCEPRASDTPKLCACQNGTYSPGAIVDSSEGKLTCTAGKWRPSTPQELGHH